MYLTFSYKKIFKLLSMKKNYKLPSNPNVLKNILYT